MLLNINFTGDLTFEEFAKSLLGEELMPPEEVSTGTELVARVEGGGVELVEKKVTSLPQWTQQNRLKNLLVN